MAAPTAANAAVDVVDVLLEVLQNGPERHKIARDPRRARDASAMVPTLTAVVGVDDRWVLAAQTRRATPLNICTSCTRSPRVDVANVVSWMCGRVAGGGRGLERAHNQL